MGSELVNNSINLYTNVIPGIIYRIINKVYGEELYESLPEIFPLVNLMDMGITNYYDISGCLNLEQKAVDEVNNNPNRRMAAIKSAFDDEEN